MQLGEIRGPLRCRRGRKHEHGPDRLVCPADLADLSLCDAAEGVTDVPAMQTSCLPIEVGVGHQQACPKAEGPPPHW